MFRCKNPGARKKAKREVSLLVLFISVAFWGCGNPEPPKIEDLHFYYWHCGNFWQEVWPGGTIKGSPLRIEATISDNTAVVAPNMTIIGTRTNLPTAIEAVPRRGVLECSSVLNDQSYFCEWTCEKVSGSYECAIGAAGYFIRGDLLTLKVALTNGQELQWQLSVSEASEADPACDGCRIIEVATIHDDSSQDWDFLTFKEITTTPETISHIFPPGRGNDAFSVAKDSVFTIKIKDSGQIDAGIPPQITWNSLRKWNIQFPLVLDAKSESFTEQFHLFDPRDNDIAGTEEAAIYRIILEAYDVADQKRDIGHNTRIPFDFIFSPDQDPHCLSAAPADLVPQILLVQLSGEDMTPVSTPYVSQTLSGYLSSWTGEIKSLQFTLSGETGTARELFIDPQSILVNGYFQGNIQLVSDWDGDGMRDGSSVINNVVVTAIDTEGRQKTVTTKFSFAPFAYPDYFPEIQLIESVPSLDVLNSATLDFHGAIFDNAEEKIRVRVNATDSTGQPAVFRKQYFCPLDPSDPNAPEKQLASNPNTDWCEECVPVGGSGLNTLALNAQGAYPAEPWQWDELPWETCDGDSPGLADNDEVLIVYQARDKVLLSEEVLTSALELRMTPIDEDEDTTYDYYDYSLWGPINQGPSVAPIIKKKEDPGAELIQIYPSIDLSLPNANIFFIDSDDSLSIEAKIQAFIGRLNRISFYQDVEAAPVYTFAYNETQDLIDFTWADIPASSLEDGERICFGAQSVTGHATLYIIEVAQVSGGKLVGITRTEKWTDQPDLELCE